MQRTELETYILETYPAEADHPWTQYPNYAVFRHISNHKWFALVMDVPKSKLGTSGEGNLPVVNVKCEPMIIGGLLSEAGFYPAYHMNKDCWITIALDGSVQAEKIKTLLDMSFNLTNGKSKKRKMSPDE